MEKVRSRCGQPSDRGRLKSRTELHSWNWMCATVWRHLVKATEVTVGLAESNVTLPPGGLLN